MSRFTRAVSVFMVFAFCLRGEKPDTLQHRARMESTSFFVRVPDSANVFFARAGRLAAHFEAGGVRIHSPEGSLHVLFENSNVGVAPSAGAEQGGAVNFLMGSDPRQWRTNLRVLTGVVYRNLYPGIDVVYGTSSRLLKSELHVAPHADPSVVALRYEGAESVQIDEDGVLIVRTSRGELREEPPTAYQVVKGRRVDVLVRFAVAAPLVVMFEPGSYDADLPLIIDPTISYSAYLGGSGIDAANAVALDATGDVYICGQTESASLASGGVVQGTFGGSVDAWVAKLNGTTGALQFLTYVGGSSQDFALGIGVGSDKAPVIAGYTFSANFPSASAFQSASAGDKEAFVAKLNPAGTAFVFSTLLGGTLADSANAIAVDSSDRIYVTGETRSLDFPTLNYIQGNLRGYSDAFVASFSPTGSLLFSTLAGGSGEDRGLAITSDGAGGVYFGGATASPDFPIKNAIQTTRKGSETGFVARLHPSTGYGFATYLGGRTGTSTNPERVNGVAIDANGYLYVAGVTPSDDFPVLNPYQSSLLGAQDAFLAKFSPTGTLLFSTYFGGITNDSANAVAVDIEGTPYIVGKTDSSGIVMPSAPQALKGGGVDGFVARFSASGSGLMLGSYLGGAASDSVRGIAVQHPGALWLAGQTQSSNFPVTGTTRTEGSAEGEAFVTKIFENNGPLALLVTPTYGTGAIQTFTFTFQHPQSAAYLNAFYGWFDARPSYVNSCVWRYDVPTNKLSIINDAGTSYSAGVTVGTAGSLTNTQCSVNVGTASVVTTGNQMSITLTVTFKNNFYGPVNIYAYAIDFVGLSSDVSTIKGAWTIPIPPKPPSAVSVTPSSGGAASSTFVYVASDPNGWNDLHFLYGIFDTSAKTAVSCLWKYDVANRRLSLMGDSGGVYVGFITQGGTQSLSNSQCTIGSGFSVVTSGTTLTISIPVTFSNNYGGTKNIYLAAEDYTASTGYKVMGIWNVPGTSNPTIPQAPPVVQSVTPNNGTGSSANFAVWVSDVNGASDLRLLYGYFDTSYHLNNTCFWKFDPIGRQLWLMNDAATTYLGPIAPAGAQTLSNAQCTIGGGYTAVSSGNDLTLTLPITFTSSFAGTKNIYVAAEDAFSSTGYKPMGTWTIPTTPQTGAPDLPGNGSVAREHPGIGLKEIHRPEDSVPNRKPR